MSAKRNSIRQIFIVAAAVALVLVGALFGLARSVLPMAASYRVELGHFIEEAIGTPVSIGSLDVGWQGWAPEVILRDVMLTDSSGGSELLQLGEVRVALRPGHVLFASELQIADVQLEGGAVAAGGERTGSRRVHASRSRTRGHRKWTQ